MVKVIWLDQAIDDVNSIAEYISQDSYKYAELIVDKIFDKTQILKKNPKIGRIVPEKAEENVRELIEGNYRIIYEIIKADLIYILGVIHSARNLQN